MSDKIAFSAAAGAIRATQALILSDVTVTFPSRKLVDFSDVITCGLRLSNFYFSVYDVSLILVRITTCDFVDVL